MHHTHHQKLACAENTVNTTTDDNRSFPLWPRGVRVRKGYVSLGGSHNAIHVAMVTANDEHVVLRGNLKVHRH